MNTNKTKIQIHKTIKEIAQSIEKEYNPTHFLTVRLKDYYQFEDLTNAQAELQKIMTCFEHHLVNRHWNKNHLKFIAIAEKGQGATFHFHILFNQGKYTQEEIETVLQFTLKKKKLPTYTFELKTRYDNGVLGYCLKEIHPNVFNQFDTSRYIPSNVLFNIDVKDTQKQTPNPHTTLPSSIVNKPKPKEKGVVSGLFTDFLDFLRRLPFFNKLKDS